MSLPYTVVCEDTTKLPRAEWLKLRKAGLGSSDVAGVMGMSTYSSPYSVYVDKRELVPDETEQSDFFAFKLALEPVVLDWAEAKGWTRGPVRRNLMLRSLACPWLTSNPDGLTPNEAVEAKALHSMDEKRWDDGVDDRYVIQAMVHMIVTGTRTCLLPVAFGSEPPREFWVDYDPELAAVIIERSMSFWRQIEDGIEPDADASAATMTALRERYYEVDEGVSVDLPREVAPWLGIRKAHMAVIKTETEGIDGIKARLMQMLGEAEVGKLDGETVCTWKANKNGKRSFLFKETKEN